MGIGAAFGIMALLGGLLIAFDVWKIANEPAPPNETQTSSDAESGGPAGSAHDPPSCQPVSEGLTVTQPRQPNVVAGVFWGIILAALVLGAARYVYQAVIVVPAQRDADFHRRALEGVEADQRARDEAWDRWKFRNCLDNPRPDNWACR